MSGKTQAERDAEIEAAFNAYRDGRVTTGESGKPDRPKPIAEIYPLWEAMWEAFDFSWEGLADAGWDRGDDANQTQFLKRWQAPAGFPGQGDIIGEGDTAYRQSNLQEYWRWSVGLEGEEWLLTDPELESLGVFRAYQGKRYHIVHCPPRHQDALDDGSAEDDLRRTSQSDGAKFTGGEAADSSLLDRLINERLSMGMAPILDGGKALVDGRCQFQGLRDTAILTLWKNDTETGEALHLNAAMSNCSGVDLSGATLGDGANFSGATLGDGASFSRATLGDGASFSHATLGERASFYRATLGDGASFFEATLGERANFFRATLGERASFFGATLGERASFSEATLGDGASFSGATLGERASFSRATLGDGASFFRATLGDGASFSEATLGDGASFFGATLGERASFSEATLGDGASFSQATLGDGTSFSGATLGERASFSDATLGDGVSFSGATLGDGANFFRATLGERASFFGATLGDGANFFRATLGERANFFRATLGKRADFSRATLGERANFSFATLGDGADFSRATLGERADFSEATLKGYASWAQALFKGHANFKDVKWNEETHYGGAFDSARFEDVANFKTTGFSAYAAFHDANFKQRLLLQPPEDGLRPEDMFATAERAATSKIKADEHALKQEDDETDKAFQTRKQAIADRIWAEVSGGYRTAKKAMEATGDFDREQTFYRFEVKARMKRPFVGMGEKLAAGFYNGLSDYGASIWRPFAGLLGFVVAFALVYTLLGVTLTGAQISGPVIGPPLSLNLQPADVTLQSFEFSMNNAFRPLSALSTSAPSDAIHNGKCDTCSLAENLLHNENGWTRLLVKSLAILQSLLSFILAFLFGLAIRRKFQIS